MIAHSISYRACTRVSINYNGATPPEWLNYLLLDDIIQSISEYQKYTQGVDIHAGGDEKQKFNFAWPWHNYGSAKQGLGSIQEDSKVAKKTVMCFPFVEGWGI